MDDPALSPLLPTFARDAEQIDPLSMILRSLRIQSRAAEFCRLSPAPGQRWPRPGPGFVFVVEGWLQLELPGSSDRVPLRRNDVVFFLREGGAVLHAAGDQLVAGGDNLISTVPDEASRGRVGASASMARIVWGELVPDEFTRQTLWLLPPVLRANADASGSQFGMRHLLTILAAELEERHPGSDFIVDRLLDALVVMTLRATNLAFTAEDGLLPVLAAPEMRAAVGAIHARPDYDWTVHELADKVGVSRSQFAAQFAKALGRPPVDYLRDLRMRLACRMLQDTNCRVRQVALRVGYATEASFSKAFSRWCGCAPGEYRRQQRNPKPQEC